MSQEKGNRFAELLFTDAVKEVQSLFGSRKAYARMETGPVTRHELTIDEAEFISQRDTFYIASISANGWPYVQHRGGPKGFLKVLPNNQIGFCDYSGNRQYITVGNLAGNNRVALILVDYPNQARLKILGTMTAVDVKAHPELMSQLSDPDYGARVERGLVIQVEAFDWNCPQHITPRWTSEEIQEAVRPLQERIKELEAKLAAVPQA